MERRGTVAAAHAIPRTAIGALWHGDVCHGPALRIGKTTKPLRIHAMLDDASRYVVWFQMSIVAARVEQESPPARARGCGAGDSIEVRGSMRGSSP